MSLLEKKLEDIKEADLDSLIASQIPESRVIEYKRDQIGNTDRDRAEFLADVTSFANTTGGELLLGIREANGTPQELVGLDSSNIDQEILRLEQIIRTGTRPALSGLNIRSIPLMNGRCVLLIRIQELGISSSNRATGLVSVLRSKF